jgi:hypothetical protein
LQLYELRKQWAADREVVMAEKLPGRVHVLRYEQFVEQPQAAAQGLSDALPEYNLDPEAMAAIVHQRTSACRPDFKVPDAPLTLDDDATRAWRESHRTEIAEEYRKLSLPYVP